MDIEQYMYFEVVSFVHIRAFMEDSSIYVKHVYRRIEGHFFMCAS